MRVLLDTNIIIHREASKVYNEDIGLLFKWLDKTKSEKIVHPLTIEELSGHKDESVVKTMKIKIDNYQELRTISDDDEKIEYIRQYDKTQNDNIDTSIVKELYNKRVDYIISEDRGIHRKAKYLEIDSKVFTINTYLEKVNAEYPDLANYNVLSVKKEYFGNIDIADPFFDSFKLDYKEFEKWFMSKSDKTSYICNTDKGIGAFLYLKVEDSGSESYHDITPKFETKKRLKIGTFKVTSGGYKLGERFLKVIFDNALINKVEEIYVTIFDNTSEQNRLTKLLQDWGFKHHGIKSTGNGHEQVYVRNFNPQINTKRPKQTYPYVSRRNKIFLVPIYPDYHTELLPDSVLNNESPADFIENQPHRNAIQKVYISRSYERNVNIGDLIVFYRTGGYHRSVTTTVAVVDRVFNDIKDEKQFIELCRKRSVFNDKELAKHWNYKRANARWVPPFIVYFNYIHSFPKRLNLAKLIELGIIADVHSAPRGFLPISLDRFNTILKESKADESYFID